MRLLAQEALTELCCGRLTPRRWLQRRRSEPRQLRSSSGAWPPWRLCWQPGARLWQRPSPRLPAGPALICASRSAPCQPVRSGLFGPMCHLADKGCCAGSENFLTATISAKIAVWCLVGPALSPQYYHGQHALTSVLEKVARKWSAGQGTFDVVSYACRLVAQQHRGQRWAMAMRSSCKASTGSHTATSGTR